MELEEGDTIPLNTDFLDGGGFVAMVVITIGIPFN